MLEKVIKYNVFTALCFAFWIIPSSYDFDLLHFLGGFSLCFLGYNYLQGCLTLNEGNNMGFLAAILSSMVFAIIFLFRINQQQLFVLSGASGILLLYHFPYRKTVFSLREIPYLKAFVIAFIWALLRVNFVNVNYIFDVVLCFYLPFLISIQFDYLHRKEDHSNLKTFGKNAKLLSFIFPICCIIGILLSPVGFWSFNFRGEIAILFFLLPAVNSLFLSRTFAWKPVLLELPILLYASQIFF